MKGCPARLEPDLSLPRRRPAGLLTTPGSRLSCPIMGKVAVPDTVKRLVDRFDQSRKVFQSPDYKEEQLRLEFLNPFFTALGWDMDNTLDTIRARNWGSVPD